jgi:hypothetical protein
MPTLLYHFTPYKNLRSILDVGQLMCTNDLNKTHVTYTDISYSSVQSRRATKGVPCYPAGVLHDYVPFYFAPRAPMLLTISQGNVQTYKEGQKPLIYLVTSVEAIVATDLDYVYTDGHAIITYTNFYNDLSHLDQLDWKVIGSSSWANTDADRDRVRKKQAEFLIYKSCPWTLIHEIGVISREMKAIITDIIQTEAHKPSIIVRRNWYYLG